MITGIFDYLEYWEHTFLDGFWKLSFYQFQICNVNGLAISRPGHCE